MKSITALIALIICFAGADIYSQSGSDSLNTKTFLEIGARANFFSSRYSSPGGTPLKLNNPVLRAVNPALRLGHSIRKESIEHNFTFDLTLSSKIKFDDGLGNNFVLNEEESSYGYAELNYYFTKRLFSIGNFHVRWGAAGSLLYEISGLKYLYGSEAKRWDLTFQPGLFLGADYTFLNAFNAYVNVRPMFTLGILNTGNYSYVNTDNNINENYNYHSSGLYSIFLAGIKYELTSGASINAGYYSIGTVNNASRELFPSDYQYVLKKLYINEGFFISYSFSAELL